MTFILLVVHVKLQLNTEHVKFFLATRCSYAVLPLNTLR